MKKRILSLAATAVLAMGIFAGCANKEVTAANSLEEIKASGVLQVGTEGTYAPFTFHDETGKLTGFDVEIAEEVAKRLGVKAEFIETKWDGMFAGLDAKRFHMVANQVGINDERKAKYDFSDPYIVSGAVLIVSEENTTITKFEDLAGKKSGQSLTSNLSKIATSYGAELVTVDGFNQAIDLILSGRIDATVNESLSFLDYKKQKPDTPIKIVAKMEAQDENGFLFNKGNEELVTAVNTALKEMKEDGTYLTISEKWFSADVSK